MKNNIKHLDLYECWFFAYISKLMYSPEPTVRSQLTNYDNVTLIFKEETEVLMFTTENENIIAFTGTEIRDIRDFKTDLDFDFDKGRYGRVHGGFLESLDNVWDDIISFVSKNNFPIIFTGHSSGGALANIAALRLNKRVQMLYTFGQPRTGNKKFVKASDFLLPEKYFRITIAGDYVTHLPPYIFGFRHAGERVHFKSDECWLMDKNRGHAAWKYYNLIQKRVGKTNPLSDYIS